MKDVVGVGAAWERLERALRRGPFSGVWVSPSLGPIPYRVWAERTYRPVGAKRQRKERLQAEAPTLRDALESMATQLEVRIVQ